MSAGYLARRLEVIVRHPAWGGGVDREHARELLGCDRRELGAAVAIAYRRGSVDLIGNYVVAPASAAAQQEVAA